MPHPIHPDTLRVISELATATAEFAAARQHIGPDATAELTTTRLACRGYGVAAALTAPDSYVLTVHLDVAPETAAPDTVTRATTLPPFWVWQSVTQSGTLHKHLDDAAFRLAELRRYDRAHVAGLLGQARTPGGHLDDADRARLFALMASPTPATWQASFPIVLDAEGMTLLHAVRAYEPDHSPYHPVYLDRTPSVTTLYAALHFAVDPDATSTAAWENARKRSWQFRHNRWTRPRM